MELAVSLVQAVVRDGDSVAKVAEAHEVSRSWLYEQIARYKQLGAAGLEPRSRRPVCSPQRVSPAVEDKIVALRKELSDLGVDAGAHTIRYHMQRAKPGRAVPSVATIWRVLKRRGFVTPEPYKRPRVCYHRFVAELPNERWQGDTTKWTLADGTVVEILNLIDDHSRFLVASRAYRQTNSKDVVACFRQAAAAHGVPYSLLTDNGLIFAGRQGRSPFEDELDRLGVVSRHSRPYHPQTCGKCERFHQTLKKYLSKQPKAATLARLQRQLDDFLEYYNNVRPHRAIGRRTPARAYSARTKARPTKVVELFGAEGSLTCHRKVSASGKVDIRHSGHRYYIYVGCGLAGRLVTVRLKGLKAEVVSAEGELIRELTLDPSRHYQGLGGA